MKSLRKELEERKKYLLKVQDAKEKALMDAPEGSLRINIKAGRAQYYQRTDPKNFTGTYIRKKEFELARKLAQKEYDKKVLLSATQELEAIEKYFLKFPERAIEEIYDATREERRQLIQPITIPKEEFFHAWVTKPYEGKGFGDTTPEFYTDKGERVRSKSEMIIADMLEREEIPYRYECPLRLKGWGIIYPDFTILNIEKRKEIYWEHLGMMDNPEYAEGAVQRIAMYEQNGIYPGENLILTYETRKTPINRKTVLRMIERYLRQ